MPSPKPSILIVDDDADTAAALRDALVRRGWMVEACGSALACLERVRSGTIDIVITDVQMPGMSGVELCALLNERHRDVLPLVLTGGGDLETAIAAIRAGAYDFLTKPLKTDLLEVAVNRAMEHLHVRREVQRLRSGEDLTRPIRSLVGTSSAMRETSAMIRRVADSDANVLILGESGTGKELVARSLHDISSRRDKPFVGINCGAMPANLLESELFGHAKGAFTDAKSARAGLFLQAEGGTLFLDEIGEMPLDMQVKLLRVLQERTVRAVGSDEEVPFDVRIVTATNRDLESDVEEKRFRADLFYRINVVAISTPSLRARPGDVEVIARHILERVAERTKKPMLAIAADALRLLVDYAWPGNVRELENSLEHAVALCRGTEIVAADLPMKIRNFQPSRLDIEVTTTAEMITLAEMERRYTLQVLSSMGGNKTQAARVLGIDRRSLYRRLEATQPVS